MTHASIGLARRLAERPTFRRHSWPPAHCDRLHGDNSADLQDERARPRRLDGGHSKHAYRPLRLTHERVKHERVAHESGAPKRIAKTEGEAPAERQRCEIGWHCESKTAQ